MSEVTNKDKDKGALWSSLRKSWQGYRIAKAQDDKAKMIEYAKKIRDIQGQLGLEISEFDVLKDLQQ